MKPVTLIAAASLAVLGACATATPVTLTQTFNPDDVAWSLEEGTNTVEGSAMLRQNGGGVVTCAGTMVSLTPYSEYAAERFTYLYGSKLGGYRAAVVSAWSAPLPMEMAYYDTVRTTTCDPQGNFEFDKIPDGDWYVSTQVEWTVGYNSQGGKMGQLISLEGGETKKIVLTH